MNQQQQPKLQQVEQQKQQQKQEKAEEAPPNPYLRADGKIAISYDGIIAA